MSAALKDKVHTIAFDDAKVASYEGLETLPLVTAMYEGKAQNGASTSAKFNNWLMSSGNGLDREEVIAIGNDAAKLGATSAVASVTMDAISAFNDSVQGSHRCRPSPSGRQGTHGRPGLQVRRLWRRSRR